MIERKAITRTTLKLYVSGVSGSALKWVVVPFAVAALPLYATTTVIIIKKVPTALWLTALTATSGSRVLRTSINLHLSFITQGYKCTYLLLHRS